MATIMILSASTSLMYFMGVFSIADGGTLSSVLSGFIGVIVTDGAAFAWMQMYLGASDNNDERAFAAIGLLTGVVGSVVASFAYLLSSATVVTLPPAASMVCCGNGCNYRDSFCTRYNDAV